jgi:hypothetical protein
VVVAMSEKKIALPADLPARTSDGEKVRPPRIRLRASFIRDLAEDWEREGKAAIRIMRIERPSEYVKIVASLMPRELEVDIANYVARVPINIVDLDEWTELNQDLISHKP